MPYIYSDTVFLDLFSGSGAIGIEALSRGAKRAVFVEKSREAASCIKENLIKTRFSDAARVMETDVLSALNRLDGSERFDIIFMDPPYDNVFEKQVLIRLAGSSLIDDDTLVVVEASNNTDFDYLDEYGYMIIKHKKYKNNCHLFLKRKDSE
jgi:16S rRNA (guanine(966)-N(2))-methyltransferase RsmD